MFGSRRTVCQLTCNLSLDGLLVLYVVPGVAQFGPANYEGLLVTWRCRDRNLGADWACNAALDQQTSFFWHDEEVLKAAKGKNAIFYSDGGKREYDPAYPSRWLAATGWAIRVSHGATTTLMAMGGTVREARLTVPHLELQAILDAHQHWHDVKMGQEPEPTLRSMLVLEVMLPSLLKTMPRSER